MDDMVYCRFPPIKYQPNYDVEQNEYPSEYPIDQRELDGISTYPQNGPDWHERRLDDRYNECFERYDVFYRSLPVNHHPYNPNLRRGSWNSRRGKRRGRHHLDDIYLPNYEDDSQGVYENFEHNMRGRRSYRGSRASANRKIVTSKFETRDIDGNKTKANKQLESGLASDSSSIREMDQSAEITSSADVEVVKQCDQKTVDTNIGGSVTTTTSVAHNKENIDDQTQVVPAVIDMDLESDAETVCLDENDHTLPNNKQLSQFSSGIDSTLDIQIKKKQSTDKNATYDVKTNEITKRHTSEIHRNVNGSVSNIEKSSKQRVESKCSIAASTSKLNNTNTLYDNNKIVEIPRIATSTDSVEKLKPATLPIVEQRKLCLNPKHSNNLSVEKDPHQHDPRLTRMKTKSEKLIYLQRLHWKSTKMLHKKIINEKVVPAPVSPKGDATNSIVVKANEDRRPSKGSLKQAYSKNENLQNRLDPHQNIAGVSNSHNLTTVERSRHDATCSNMISLTQCGPAQRKEPSNVKERKGENHISMDTKSKVISRKPKPITSISTKRRKIIMNRKFVCQSNHYVLDKFYRDSIPKLNFCCFVIIRRGECTVDSKKDTSNFLNSIDTRKSYLPQNNIRRTVEFTLDKSICQKLEDGVNKTVAFVESKAKTCFDRTEQDEEIKFLAERVKESTTKVNHDQITSSAEPVIVKNKMLQKDVFMKKYKTKPAKLSGSTIEHVTKKNDKSPVASNNDKNKEEIKPLKLSELPNKRIRKQLYDPQYDSMVCGDKLREIFGEDLADVTSVDVKRIKRKNVEDVGCSKQSNLPNKNNVGTSQGERASLKRMSLTCEDAPVLPKKILKRRSTIHSSIFENNTTAQDAEPVASRDLNSVSETIQLISKELQMTNGTHNLSHSKISEMPKNTSEEIINILSGSKTTSIFEPTASTNHDQQIVCSRTENKVSDIASSTYFGLPDTLPENISENTKVLPSPTIKYQRAVSRLVEDELTETTEIQTGDVLVKPYIDLTVDNENCESFSNVVITNVSTDSSTQVEVKSDPDEDEILLNIRIIDAPQDDQEIKQEIFSFCELLGEVKREEIEGSCVKHSDELLLKFATSAKEENEYWEEIVDSCHSPLVEPASAVSSDVNEYLGKAKYNAITVYSSVDKKSIDNTVRQTGVVPSSQQAKQIFNHSVASFSAALLRQRYLRFYHYVSEILRGYITLQRGYSASYQLIYETLRQFPHPLNNFIYEDVSLQLIMYDRRKYYGWLLFTDIMKLPENLPDFNFTEFLRVTVQLLCEARVEISVSILVHHLLELIVVYYHKYKQHRTSDKFRRNIEFFSDNRNNRNGISQPECCLTLRQRTLLKAQILAYLQLSGNGTVNLKNGKHLSTLTYPARKANSDINVVPPPSTVGNPIHEMSCCVQNITSAPIQHDNRIIESNSTLQQPVIQTMKETNIKNPRKNQNVNQPPPPYQSLTGFHSNTIKNQTISPHNLQHKVNLNKSVLTNTNSVHSTILVTNKNQLPSKLAVSTSSASNNKVLYTNRKTPPNILQENISNTKSLLTNLIPRSVTKTVADRSTVKTASANAFTMDNGQVCAQCIPSSSHNFSSGSGYSQHTTLPVIQQMETSSTLENNNPRFVDLTEKSTTGDCLLSLNVSQQNFSKGNPLLSTNYAHGVLQKTGSNSSTEPSSLDCTKRNVSGAVDLTNRQSSPDGVQQLKATCSSNTTLTTFGISNPSSIQSSDVIKLKSQSMDNSSIQHNSVSYLTNNVAKNQLQSSAHKEDSLSIVNAKSNKDRLHNESYTNEKSSIKSAANVDITREEDVDTGRTDEDEVIDLTWMDDFTEEELTKEVNQNEFMYIKMEAVDENSTSSRSPGDSGIDSPTIQRDSDNLEAGCHSIPVEEEEYPYFFSYQFE